MIQVSDIKSYKRASLDGAAVTIGNFDGCHQGHQKLVAEVIEYANTYSLTPMAITFDPRPDAYFRGLNDEALLFTPNQKSRCLDELGVKIQIVQRFDAAFSSVTHDEFLNDYLMESLDAKAIVVGDDFKFGRNRLGNLDFLRTKSLEKGIRLNIGHACEFQHSRISSSRIRQAIASHGDMTNATLMLGRPYLLEGSIEKGDQLGRKLGFPTANLGGCKQILPKFGVYLGFVWLENPSNAAEKAPITRMPTDLSPAVINIGVRPSVSKQTSVVRIEAHILTGDFPPDSLYNLRAGYYITQRLRDERRFDALAELQNQIKVDIQQARYLLSL